MARRTPVGSGGQATPTLGNAVGSQGGEEMHTMTLDELVSHTHQFEAAVLNQRGAGPGNNVPMYKGPYTTSPTGNNQPFNVMQPSLVFHYFIKY
jgi:microcystin-dependent protein